MNRALHSLVVELTKSCGLSCSHCYLRGEMKSELSKDKLMSFITECIQLGLLKVTLTGGEPLNYIGLIDILKYFKELDISVCLMSSLNAHDDSVLETILDYQLCDEIRTSIYGGCDKTHDMITGNKGSFSTTLLNLRKSKECVKVCASVQLMRSNFDERYEIYSLLENEGIDYTTNIKIFDSKLDRQLNRHNLELLTHADISTYIRENSIQCVPRISCNAGMNSIWINSDGNVYPCIFFPYIVGNICNNTAFDIWERCCLEFPKKVLYEQCTKCENKDYCQMCVGINYALCKSYDRLNLLNCYHAKAIKSGSQ